jgi:hypothetical protein
MWAWMLQASPYSHHHGPHKRKQTNAHTLPCSRQAAALQGRPASQPKPGQCRTASDNITQPSTEGYRVSQLTGPGRHVSVGTNPQHSTVKQKQATRGWQHEPSATVTANGRPWLHKQSTSETRRSVSADAQVLRPGICQINYYSLRRVSTLVASRHMPSDMHPRSSLPKDQPPHPHISRPFLLSSPLRPPSTPLPSHIFPWLRLAPL